MGEIIIFKDILDNIVQHPRDVTLFGEKNLFVTWKRSYDLYYYIAEGIGHNKNLDNKFRPFPVFLDPGKEEKLIEKLKEYNGKYHNDVGGVCGDDDVFGFYKIKDSNEKCLIYPVYKYYAFDKAEFINQLSKEQFKDSKNFEEELHRKIEYIKKYTRIN